MCCCLFALSTWSLPRIVCVTPSSWSSIATAKFIKGQTLYLSFVLGCTLWLILNAGQSRIAGFGSLMSVLILTTAAPGSYSTNILSQRANCSLIGKSLQGQASFFKEKLRNISPEHVQTYAFPLLMSFSA